MGLEVDWQRGEDHISSTAAAVLAVILVRREDRPGSWWGANGWRANSTDRRIYAEGTQRHE